MAIKRDCFGYNETTKTCSALNDLFCKDGACKFYCKRGEALKRRAKSAERRKSKGWPMTKQDEKDLRECYG